jgi:class 3 adenylate cyclase
MTITINEQLLEEKLVAIEKVRSWSPRTVSKLENTIRSGSDDELFRVNPIEWAKQKHVDEHEAIELFLHSAKIGLFNMDWNVICPCCGSILHSLSRLHSLKSRSTCTICMLDEVSTLDDYVQVVFTLPPTVRDLCYHHPETLALDDFLFKYLTATNARWNFGETVLTFREMLPMIQKYFSLLPKGETLRVETSLEPMMVLVANRLTDLKGIALIVLDDDEPVTEPQKAVFRLTDAGFETTLPMIDPNVIKTGSGTLRGSLYAVKPGPIILEIEQASGDAPLLIWQAPEPLSPPDVENFDTNGGRSTFTPCLTAKRLFACQTFHDLFRSEVFQESQGFSVKDVTIMFTDLKSSTQLYNQIGDLNAFALVREHYGVLNKAIIENHGAVVKTIGDAIMATFAEPSDAVCAGLEMLQGLREMNSGSSHGDLALKVGIHRGAAISVTLNERIDYFGQTINTASRVQGVAGGNEIYVTDDIYSAAGVADLVTQQCDIESMSLELKGIDEPVKVFKLIGGH